jgi:hypothetical protein
VADDGSGEALYDGIAQIYDPWSRSVVEDVDFYVEEAVASGGPVVELAIGDRADLRYGSRRPVSR